MRKFLGNYDPFYTKTVQEQICALSTEDKKRLENRIQDLISDPWHNTKFGKGQYRGKRKLWLNRSDRLIFVICEECRELNHFIYNRCRDCDDTPENTIVIAFIIFGHDY